MLQELKFVAGAVAKKDFVASMTHFCIESDSESVGFVRSFNGAMALGSPINFDIPCKPKAADLIKAIAKSEHTPTLTMTPNGRLSVRSGKHKTTIECVTDETPHVNPEGTRVDFDGVALLEALKVLEPFIGTDASRAWASGVLLRDASAYATNNVVILQYWLNAAFPITVNLPRAAVLEMLRIDEAPTHAQMNEFSMSFHYSGRRWLRTQLLDVKWPDIDKVFGDHTITAAAPVNEEIFEALESIRPFADKMGRVFLKNQKASTVPHTSDGKENDERHSEYDLPWLLHEGIYQIDMLKLLQGVATHADFSQYPKAAVFYGKQLRGAIVGMRP